MNTVAAAGAGARGRALKELALEAAWATVPLGLRKRAAGLISRSRRLPDDRRLTLSMLAVGDLARRDNKAFHKFLWSHHLAYASYYEVGTPFTSDVEESRRLFFADLGRCLAAHGRPAETVGSVLDVGCSIGHNLRWLERELFTSADELVGVDLDGHAVAQGARALAAEGSRVKLLEGDMERLDEVLPGACWDVVFCAGVLLYLEQADASRVVASMLARSRFLTAFAALAHPERDNRELARSQQRGWDRSHIHNVDAMVEAAGGRVVARRWQRERLDARQTVYFVFAVPG